ncbi:NAD(P)-binding domain-containing protein, partial [Kitasatospora nipponensis]|uniref:NAD(P)-binding domain-containing protein n=1 Tax=Kitasatospora nipponensis TaxID=258049 RepID=UPI0031D460A4
METKIALLGLGTMGAPMARRLLAAGHELTVWNRTAARAEPTGRGLSSAGSAAPRARGS